MPWLALAAALAVPAVMQRLAWLDHRNPSARMKRGEPSPLWYAIPLIPISAALAWWFVGPDAARWIVALGCGAPFLLATDRFWMTRSRHDEAGED